MTRSRLAPTPSGFLHLGNAFNFLLAEKLTGAGGSLRLRIDDGDAPRTRREYIDDIFETLDWLGIHPDKGPGSAEDHLANYSQRLRLPVYRSYLRELAATGRLFACTCSRAKTALISADGQYPGTCRHLRLPLDTAGASLRLLTPQNTIVTWQDELLGKVRADLYAGQRDPVLQRRDGVPAYAISSLADDVAYEINLVVRGQDLCGSTAVQRYIATLLPRARSFLDARFVHHALMQTDGVKLSKSAGAQSLRAIRQSGSPAKEIRDLFLEWTAAWSPSGLP